MAVDFMMVAVCSALATLLGVVVWTWYEGRWLPHCPRKEGRPCPSSRAIFLVNTGFHYEPVLNLEKVRSWLVSNNH